MHQHQSLQTCTPSTQGHLKQASLASEQQPDRDSNPPIARDAVRDLNLEVRDLVENM